MIHTEWCPTDLHGWLSHRFHGGEPQISQVHADEILSFSHGGHGYITSNPQPIGFRGNLLVKRPKFFYCTYSLGITETS